ILLLNSIYISIKEYKIREVYYSCVTEQNYFCYLNKSDKIRNISYAFASLFNATPGQLKNNRFLDCLQARYSNLIINENKYNSSNISHVFDAIKTSKSDLKLVIRCLDLQGNDLEICLIDRPIINNNKFVGHVLFGKTLDSKTLDNQEEELNSKNIKLEMNKLRITTILQNSNDSIYFYNLDNNSVWANNHLVDTIGLSGNAISYEELKRRIHPDDLVFYNNTIEALNKENSTYDVKYRIRDKYDYTYVHERGQKVYGPQTEIIGIILTDKKTSLNKSGNPVLDSLRSEEELKTALNTLSSRAVELVCLRFEDIRIINEKYGRQTGDQIMADYINLISKYFVNDNLFFRTGGLEFFFIMTDYKKMERLKAELEKGVITKAPSKYGENNITIHTTMGIIANTIVKDSNKLISFARQSNSFVHNENYTKDYNYYE
ncbi:MAG: diguanylate cyclase, partial [Acholeplasmatales bacterium]|nr:diguanylate cyclase [Acholeplasmatales bacterium]